MIIQLFSVSISIQELNFVPFLQNFARYVIQDVKRFIGAGAISVLLIDLENSNHRSDARFSIEELKNIT